ncbi:MFS transporter [Mycobacterium lacus]|uniref:MFS transporter n=1 Tax=Mycobacterium lacus TaxID=169765 RepID=A0A7I7NFY4_9MYCO|nr:MFS transporter [Mycobacterium lacus]BBX95582.1 MFS transporter [Mycobacterium lacus]
MTTATTRFRGPWRVGSSHSSSGNPWNALWAMMIGFFMIMLDSTIVAIANPTIMAKLAIGYDTVVWVTSAYLLGYAVLLLVAGRLGDRFGPKNLYLIGLVVFTVASVWCGLSGSAGMLIAARVAQGVGAGVLTPQTLSTITRIFPAHRRGAAMSVWGATAGVASLVGPLAGGGLVDSLGWQWIFFVNVPVGIVALVLAVWLVPVLPTQLHQFDWIGVGLSGVGMFLIVFGLQEGESAHWQPWIWAVIVAGVGFLSTFIYWQALNTREPLIPLDILDYRNYSLCNVGVAITAFAMTGMVLPLTFYAQAVCGLSPTRSALLIAPMAITSGVLAPLVGVIVDRSHPLPVLGFGFSALAIGLTWLAFEMAPDTPIWRLMLPFSVIGVSMAFVWSPLTATASRDLPPRLAGAGSGVYNATRQLGAVLGSAGMAAFMTARIAAEMPPMPGGAGTPSVQGAPTLQLPEYVREPFSAAMSQSMLLPAFISLFGIVAVLFLEGFTGPVTTDEPVPADGYDDSYDDYVEYVIRREPDIDSALQPVYDEGDTEPLVARVGQLRPASAEARHSDSVESSHGVPADPVSAPLEQIGFAHNGSPADDGQRFRPIAEYSPWRNKHRRADPDDYGTSGRHSFRGD